MKVGVFQQLPLEQALDKIRAAGVEAVEIGTGGYPGDASHRGEKFHSVRMAALSSVAPCKQSRSSAVVSRASARRMSSPSVASPSPSTKKLRRREAKRAASSCRTPA